MPIYKILALSRSFVYLITFPVYGYPTFQIFSAMTRIRRVMVFVLVAWQLCFASTSRATASMDVTAATTTTSSTTASTDVTTTSTASTTSTSTTAAPASTTSTSSTSVIEDPCFPNIRLASTPQLLQLSAVQRCLNNLTLSAEAVYYTLTELDYDVNELYGFRHIASSSRLGKHNTGSCNLEVHDVKVDLKAEWNDLRHEALTFFGVSDFEGLLNMPSAQMNSYRFHQRIADAFRALNDAHTSYSPPHAAIFPYFTYLTDTGHQVAFRISAPAGADARAAPQVSVEEGTFGFRLVDKIGQLPAWEWIVSQAKTEVGQYKSLGGRVNELLNLFANGKFLTSTVPWPEDESLQIHFVDGTKLAARVMVSTTKLVAYSRSSLQLWTTWNKPWVQISRWLDAHLKLAGPGRLDALRAISAEYVQLNEQSLEAPADERPPLPVPLATAAERRLRAAELVAKWPVEDLVSRSGVKLAPVLAGYWLPLSKEIIAKHRCFLLQ